MGSIKKYLNKENWNIGFIENETPDTLIANRSLSYIKWLKHTYTDRAFADPHILKITEEEIIILCEELVFGNKGIISKLTIDRRNYTLKDRREILKLPTHLSYPAILERNGRVYVYPENSESGKIRLYQWDEDHDRMVERSILVDDSCTDFTICPRPQNGKFYALSTKLRPDSEENAFLFSADDILGPYEQVNSEPVVKDRSCSRPGGNFFLSDGIVYRPAQDCVGRYGKGLKIMQIESFEPFREKSLFELSPKSYSYSLGLHTLNFKDGLAVIDGYGYLYPTIGRILNLVNNLRLKLTKR